MPLKEALFQAEQDFYAYMTQELLTTENAFCALWGDYEAMLRMEPFLDGYLLTGLASLPSVRRRGIATKLLQQTLTMLPDATKIYSHVDKDNIPSVAFHEKFGFQCISNSAKMLDGSLLHNFWTFFYGK